MVLGLRYLQALEAAGAVAVVAPPMGPESLEPLLARAAGVCLSGGPDLDPAGYGQPRHGRTGANETELDRFELELVRAADERRMPILAICRGMQVLNVARGGTLHQHLPDVVGDQIAHRQRLPAVVSTHPVTVYADTRLGQIVGARPEVNSFHHQGVAELGAGLIETGRAPDGTIESLEAGDRDFVLGVQWHAESLTAQPVQAALFRAFVAAASEHDRAGHGLARAA